MDVKYFFVREKVDDGGLDITQISTEHQIADIMTKPLDTVRLTYLYETLFDIKETVVFFSKKVSVATLATVHIRIHLSLVPLDCQTMSWIE